ncbi:hypothetical protein PUMCH_003489 [Australozyma saopauloensis]|uniref:Zn(2)-C6 fungal-type domain-containing protein n=1 Tax=Australozyma saopauloensis TaxID=291208 RepID=A0AAX4HE26_9ASCO|nr:hypothetical protein PUMCH_003489 [[Candida] saopauloensis]
MQAALNSQVKPEPAEKVGVPSADTQKSTPKKEMPLSCQRCRIRKVKCNFAHPCLSCVKLGVECIQIPNDMRKKRPRANYVLTLEKQIDTVQKFFSNLQKLESVEDRNKYLDANMAAVGQELGLGSESAQQPAKVKPLALPKLVSGTPGASSVSSEPATNKNRPIYGPTNVYDNYELDLRLRTTAQRREARDINTLRALNCNPDILHCLKLFFSWQYPDNSMFVFREAFLLEFFHPKPNSLYCLPVLVLSVCALGARMSDVDSIYFKSISYYNEARSCLLSSFEHPSITSVQSFLLLAFYDICNGHNSTGWMLLGNAIRMGFDLGFQLSPEVWFLKNAGTLKAIDRAIRSRIYWGCFMADHFISLVLGRPSLLKLLDASIPETEDLPELDGIDEYKYIPDTDTNISDPLKNIINLINISDNMLNDVFTKSESDAGELHDTLHDDYDLESRLSKLFQYNNEIQKWRDNLPLDLKWNQEILKVTADNPTLSGVRYYYYILLLCLNRPFVGLTKEFKDHNHLSSAYICSQVIDDLYIAINRFQDTHGLRRASIFIVYCSILSISVILLTVTTEDIGEKKKTMIKYFMSVLAGCSKTWGLAEKSYRMIRSKLDLEFAGGPDFQVATEAGKKSKLKKARKLMPPPPPAEIKLEHIEVTSSENLGSNMTPLLPQQETPSAIPLGAESVSFLEKSPNEEGIPNASDDSNQCDYFEENSGEFFGGPPVLMTSDLFNEDWEALFPDSIFSQRLGQHHD